MHTKNITPLYTLMMAMYWMSIAVISSFASVYLLDRGFTNSEIGLAVALACTVSAILQPLVADFADRPGTISLNMIFRLLVIVSLLAGLMILFTEKAKTINVLFFGACICLAQLLQPLLNSLGVGTMNNGYRLNIGISRAGGSASYALCALALGIVVTKLGTKVIPVFACLLFMMLFALSFLLPAIPKNCGGEKSKSAGVLGFFRKYPRYIGVLIGCIFIFIHHTFLNSFTYQITVSRGGDSGAMGIAMAIAAGVELIPMLFFSKLLKRHNAAVWFRISGVFFTLKSVATLLSVNVVSFYAAQLIQIGGWGIISVASIFYINSIMAPEDSVKGQAFYTMSYTFGNVLGAALGGRLIDSFGINAMLLASVVFAALGTVIIMFFTKNDVRPKAPEFSE